MLKGTVWSLLAEAMKVALTLIWCYFYLHYGMLDVPYRVQRLNLIEVWLGYEVL
jgi:hypothetical protein